MSGLGRLTTTLSPRHEALKQQLKSVISLRPFIERALEKAYNDLVHLRLLEPLSSLNLYRLEGQVVDRHSLETSTKCLDIQAADLPEALWLSAQALDHEGLVWLTFPPITASEPFSVS